MGEAGYIAGRRYDAVKNAFLSYQTAERKPKKVRSRISRSGETFSAGRKILGKVCIVGGYIRLFLALDPKQYNADKYHHKDYSEVVRYAKFPFMIKLSSDRQVKYAQELIADVMRENGFETDRSYFPQDQAFIFKKPRRKAVAEAAEVSPQIVYLPYADEEAAASEDIGEPDAIDVKLPKRASVVDKQGNRIGKIRQSVWYDENEVEKGTFRKEETNDRVRVPVVALGQYRLCARPVYRYGRRRRMERFGKSSRFRKRGIRRCHRCAGNAGSLSFHLRKQK